MITTGYSTSRDRPTANRVGRLNLATLLLTAAWCGGCTNDGATVFQGYVEGDYVQMAPAVAGRIAELHVRRGEQVQPGALLFSLEREVQTAEREAAAARFERADAALRNLQKGRRAQEIVTIEAQLAQASANRELAEARWQRRLELSKSGLVTKEELDQARAELDGSRARVEEIASQLATARLAARSDEIRAAEAEVAAARAALRQADWILTQTSPVAPTEALVADTFYRPGEWVAAGAPVVSLLPPANRLIRFFIPEPKLAALRLGQPLSVTCDGCPAPLAAQVSFIAPNAEFTPPVIYSRETRTKLVFLVEARPTSPDAPALRPGQPVDVRIAGP